MIDTVIELKISKVHAHSGYNMSRATYRIDVTMLGENVLNPVCIQRIEGMIRGYFPETHGFGHSTVTSLTNLGVTAVEQRQAGVYNQYSHDWKTGTWELQYETAGND